MRGIKGGWMGALVTFLCVVPLRAQAADQGSTAKADSGVLERTFYLKSTNFYNDANEVTQALRNLLDPHNKIYLVPSQNAILIAAPPDQMALAEKILSDLDRPRRAYRLTYTVSEVDNGKRVGVQHFTMQVVTGQRASIKQGSKVPVVTGSFDSGHATANTQVTYLDVGLNFDVTLDQSDAGVQLKSKIEQSSVAEEKSGVGPQDPVVRQTFLEGTSRVQVGKPLVVGELDIPGSTRHLVVEVLVEQEKQ